MPYVKERETDKCWSYIAFNADRVYVQLISLDQSLIVLDSRDRIIRIKS